MTVLDYFCVSTITSGLIFTLIMSFYCLDYIPLLINSNYKQHKFFALMLSCMYFWIIMVTIKILIYGFEKIIHIVYFLF